MSGIRGDDDEQPASRSAGGRRKTGLAGVLWPLGAPYRVRLLYIT